VLDLQSLTIKDRWISSASFSDLYVPPSGGTVFAQASDSDVVMVFDHGGGVSATATSPRSDGTFCSSRGDN
jgi:hypothetical protein